MTVPEPEASPKVTARIAGSASNSPYRNAEARLQKSPATSLDR